MMLFAAAFGLVLLTVVLPVLLRRPQWTVFGLSFLLALNANHVLSYHFGIGLADPALLAATLGLVFCDWALRPYWLTGLTRYAIAVSLLLAAILNSLAWSWAPGISLDKIVSYLPNILLTFPLMLLIHDRQRLVHAIAGMAVAALLLAALTVVQALTGQGAQDFLGLAKMAMGNISEGVDALRPTGPLEDPNYFAQMLLPGLGVWLALALAAPGLRLRLLSGVAVAVVVGAVLLTSSRGAFLAVAIMALILMIRERRAGLLLVLAPPMLAVLLMMPGYAERLVNTAVSGWEAMTGQAVGEASVAGRLAEMEAATRLFLAQPVAGTGFDTFQDFYQEVSVRADLKLRSADRSAHSLYLETAAEQGLIGLVALAVLIGLAFAAALRAARNAPPRSAVQVMIDGLIAGALGLCLCSIFLHDAYAQHFWLTLTLLFSSERALCLRASASRLNNRKPIHAG